MEEEEAQVPWGENLRCGFLLRVTGEALSRTDGAEYLFSNGILVVSLEHPHPTIPSACPPPGPEAQAYCRVRCSWWRAWVSVQEDPTPSKCLVTQGQGEKGVKEQNRSPGKGGVSTGRGLESLGALFTPRQELSCLHVRLERRGTFQGQSLTCWDPPGLAPGSQPLLSPF